MPAKKKPTLPPDVRKALETVLAYSWEDECEDASGSDNLENHIFSALVTVDNWLNGTDHVPEDYWKEEDEV
jgi:hypothetical protein